ncbi:MAG: acyl carrier protein [Kutzneria sp.]|nr:acyl carrier protein [Kutzneria sp.]
MTESRDDILASVARTMAEVTDVSEADVRLDKHLIDDLELDSLSLAEFGVALQERFGIELSDEQVAELQTVSDVVDVVRAARDQGVTAG